MKSKILVRGFFLLILLVMLNSNVLANEVEYPTLRCPIYDVGENYPYKWGPGDFSEDNVYLQIGNTDTLKSGTYITFDADERKVRIPEKYDELEKLAELSRKGRLYARVKVIDEFLGKAYSNICRFNLKTVSVLNPNHWVKNSPYIITEEKPYTGGKSLMVPYYSDTSTSKSVYPNLNLATIFGSKRPFDLEGSKVTFKIYTPSGCDGTRYAKNYIQLHVMSRYGTLYGGTKLFSGSGWKTVEMNLDGNSYELVNGFSIKIGTYGKCNGNFFIDDFRIEKDGIVNMYNFE